jgi:hypothetical protein
MERDGWERVLVQHLKDRLLGDSGTVADLAQVAEHDRTGEFPALAESLAQQPAAFFIAQVEVRTGVRVGPQQVRVVVGFHEDKIGVLEAVRKSVPIPEIGGHHNLFLPAPVVDRNLKPKSPPDSIVGHPKRDDREVPDRKRPVKKRADLEVQERRLVKIAAGQRSNLLLININGNPAIFQYPERIMVDVIAMQVGDHNPVNATEEFCQGIPAGFHGGESSIDEEDAIARSQEQRIPRTAAA